jgi:putative transposase
MGVTANCWSTGDCPAIAERRRIAALLRDASWQVSDKRVERLWRRDGLKVPMKQPGKGRLRPNDGSCIRLRPEHRNHVWSYDFVHHRTDDGKPFRTLDILAEHSRKCMAILKLVWHDYAGPRSS